MLEGGFEERLNRLGSAFFAQRAVRKGEESLLQSSVGIETAPRSHSREIQRLLEMPPSAQEVPKLVGTEKVLQRIPITIHSLFSCVFCLSFQGCTLEEVRTGIFPLMRFSLHSECSLEGQLS